MGRKTYESIGRALPGRTNIILTRNRSLDFPGCLTMYSLQQAIDYCRNEQKVFVIGGGDLFISALPVTDTIIVTALQRDITGDVYFDKIDPNQFRIAESRDFCEEEPYTIIRYERIDKP